MSRTFTKNFDKFFGNFSRKFKGNRHLLCKAIGSAALLGTCGIIIYNRDKIQELLQKFSAPKIDKKEKKKRPDYIYIKYHIYKESLRLLKEQEEEDKKWINVIINPIGKWWKTIKHSIAWRLLNIAKNGDHHERVKAVRQLYHIDHLKDWDFRHLAQMCDARTAVSLARLGADQRWFLPVPMAGFVKHPYVVLKDLHNFLCRLDSNKCVANFFAKFFPEPDPPEDDIFIIAKQIQLTSSGRETVLLKEIISFLHHLTKDRCMAESLLKDGILAKLMEFKKIFSNENETLSNLCKVLANIAVLKHSVEHFHVTGWVGVLAEWQKSSDIRLKVISAKTLANLDHDDPNYIVYPAHVFPLHPLRRSLVKPKADVIFIHGLVGGVFVSWRQKDRTPKELYLYGKNGLYAEETDDLYLAGADIQKKRQTQKTSIINLTLKKFSNFKIGEKRLQDWVPLFDLKDQNAEGFMENMSKDSKLKSDWEVVHPDVPLYASEGAEGPFSVPGDKWEDENPLTEYTNCWPMEWLPRDFPNIRIIGIDYTSALTEWSSNFTKYCPCEKTQGHIDIRASSILDGIVKAEVGKRPIIWVGHSMGGLLAKLVLLKSYESEERDYKQVAKKTKAIVFLGTPHRGSPVAKWKQHMQIIISPSIEVKELEENSPKLLQLHKQFMDLLKAHLRKVKVVSIAEGSPTMLTTFKFPLRIVTEESARIDYGDFYVVDDDHLSLSKPICRQSFLYQRFLKIIEEVSHEKRQRREDKGQSSIKQRLYELFDRIKATIPLLATKLKNLKI